MLALLLHGSEPLPFLVLSEAFHVPFWARWGLLHHHCFSEVLKKHSPTSKYLQLWVYTRRRDASRLLSVFFGRNTELVRFSKAFKAQHFSKNKSLCKINTATELHSLLDTSNFTLVQQYQTNSQEWFMVWKTRFSAGDLKNSILLAYQRAR